MANDTMGSSFKASSEASSVRARAYPVIWEQKTKDAIDKNIRRDGEAFEDEKWMAHKAVDVIAKILKDVLPGHVFASADAIKNTTGDTEYPYEVEAKFSKPGAGYDKRILGLAFPTLEQADQLALQLSEGMDHRESGRPLNLRREPDEREEQKDLDKRDLANRQAKEEAAADKRRGERFYQSFVQKVKDDMEKERKARL